jgi:HK97 family phage prohead protease
MHGYEDPLNAIGKLQDIRIEDKELVVDGQLDLNNERAVRVYEAMLTGKLNEFSIGYAIRDEELVKDAEGHPHYYLIKDLELLEISIVFAGANRHTRLISIKAIEAMMDAGEFDMARIASDEPSMRVKRQLQILNYDYVPVDVFMALDRSIEKELHIETDKEKSVETETVVDETVVDETVVDGDPGEQKVIPEEILEAFEQIDGLRKAIEEWAGVNTTEPVVETKIVEPDPEREADEALLAQLASLEG